MGESEDWRGLWEVFGGIGFEPHQPPQINKGLLPVGGELLPRQFKLSVWFYWRPFPVDTIHESVACRLP